LNIDRTLNLPCSVHLDARPIPLMSMFSFVQQVARYGG